MSVTGHNGVARGAKLGIDPLMQRLARLSTKQVVLVALAATSLACSGSDEATQKSPAPVFTPDPNLPGPPEWNDPVAKPADDQALGERGACAYSSGAMPAATQGVSRPNGAEIPVDTIVVAMMENRSFDHYFQKIGSVGVEADVASDDFTNPDTEGNPVAIHPANSYCFVDTAHNFEAIARQINGGQMDGFVITNAGNHEAPAPGLELIEGERAMAYYTEADIPLTYFLAQNFSIGDRYFASTPTQTWPNRMYLFAATSFGESNNDFPTNVDKTIFDYLTERGISWKFYATAVPTMGIVTLAKIGDYSAAGNLVNISEFAVDAAAGTLPQVAFVDPDGTSTPDIHHSDEHPPAIMQLGQKWLGEIISALAQSPHWERSAMFITYDEHGGLYDHVVPPPSCPPDDRFEEPGVRFDQYGIRVPFLVVSPFAKRGYVSHAVYDHTSILRFIEARFVMPALTNRDANAEAPWDVFDFESPPNAERPAVPIPVVDQAKLDACDVLWGI